MAETATEAATTQTEATTSSEATSTSLLTSTEGEAKTETAGEKTETAKTEEGTKTEETKVEGAPETYDFKAPEGKAYDSSVLDSFSNAAKAANLTQDAAQKLLESMAPSLATRQQEQVDAIRAGWLESTKTDKDFGGDKLQENLAVAKKAVEEFASPDLRKLLDDTGLGNHPEVIRAFLKIGKGMSEDKFVAGAAKPPAQKSTAEVLYDKS